MEHWLTWWVWTYDPRETVAYIPFVPFPRQTEFIRWLKERETNKENGLVEKSRDAGVSWLCCAYAAHCWLFRPGDSTGFGSRKEEYVDKAGDPDSLFEKIRIILDKLPPWMLPRGYVRDKHATFRKIVNPESGATITGESGDNIGRGGRKSRYFVDESAFLERAYLVERSLSQTTNCRIDVSTPNGIGNVFYQRRFSGVVPVFTFNWRDDPRKGEAWYAEQKAKLGPVTLAQEVDIDYTASIEGVCIPAEWVRSAVKLDLTPSGVMSGGMDIAEEGKDKTVIAPRHGPIVKDLIAWGQCNTTQTAYRAIDECKAIGITKVNYDSVGVGTGPKGIWNSMEDCPIKMVPINVGETPTTNKWPDGKTSQEKFANLKAEAWWLLRSRFEKTFEHVVNGIAHPHCDMISIPDDPQLIAELSTVRVQYTETGKIKIESKKELSGRGVKSPDYAEAVVLAFVPEQRKLTLKCW